MKPMITAAMVAALASAAMADYSDHHGVELFSERPCTEAVGTIDGSMARSTIGATASIIATTAMAWGFILGFDTAMGGLQGDEETTLVRLRKACAASPDTPAIELLRRF